MIPHTSVRPGNALYPLCSHAAFAVAAVGPWQFLAGYVEGRFVLVCFDERGALVDVQINHDVPLSARGTGNPGFAFEAFRANAALPYADALASAAALARTNANSSREPPIRVRRFYDPRVPVGLYDIDMSAEELARIMDSPPTGPDALVAKELREVWFDLGSFVFQWGRDRYYVDRFGTTFWLRVAKDE